MTGGVNFKQVFRLLNNSCFRFFVVWRACLAEKRNANEKQKDVSTDCRLFAGLWNDGCGFVLGR